MHFGALAVGELRQVLFEPADLKRLGEQSVVDLVHGLAEDIGVHGHNALVFGRVHL